MPAIEYNVLIEGSDGKQAGIQWGEEPGWIEAHRDLLDRAKHISLIAKKGSKLPTVITSLEDGKRWILFSRVYGQATGSKQIRLYALGWQRLVKGINVKSLQWVYPGGAVENAEEPTFWQAFL